MRVFFFKYSNGHRSISGANSHFKLDWFNKAKRSSFNFQENDREKTLTVVLFAFGCWCCGCKYMLCVRVLELISFVASSRTCLPNQSLFYQLCLFLSFYLAVSLTLCVNFVCFKTYLCWIVHLVLVVFS